MTLASTQENQQLVYDPEMNIVYSKGGDGSLVQTNVSMQVM